jgi:O-antigen ligase
MQRAPAEPLSRREGAAWVLAAGVGALLAGAVFFGGGSGDGSVLGLGIALLVLLTAAGVTAALRLVRLPRLDRAATAGVAGAAALVGWTAVTIAWSIAGDRSWAAFNKGLVHLGFLAAGILLGVLGSRTARAAALLLAAVLGAALLWALLGKAIPALFPDGDRAARLRNPVGYWNGLALLADVALALGLWLAAACSRRSAARAAGALLLYAAVLVLALTASRTGVLGAALAVALWLALSPERVEGALAAVGAAVPATAVAVWAGTRPALVEDGVSRAERVDDGAIFAAFALAGAAAAVGLVLALARLRLERSRRAGRALALGGLAAVGVGVAALAISVGNPAAWAWDEFAGGKADVNDPSRLVSLSSNNRSAWWGEAWEVFADRPLRGAGAGTFEIARKRERDDATSVTQPHSVPLQLLAGGGIVALALALSAAAGLGVGAARSLRRLDRAELAAARALAVAPAVWALHALVDYDLDFVAVTAPVLVALGALLAAGRPTARAPTWPALAAAAGAALLVAASLSLPALSSRAVERSTEALDDDDPARAAGEARRAQSLNPLALEPLFARGRAAERAGDDDAAHSFYEQAVELQPENPEPWLVLGRYRLYVLGDACGAYFALNAAYTLDPNGRQWAPGGPLDVARAAVDAGACESDGA